MALVVKNLPANVETYKTWVRSLGWEDPLEEGMATHPSILAWRIPMNRGAWWVAKSQTQLKQLSRYTCRYISQRLFPTALDRETES